MVAFHAGVAAVLRAPGSAAALQAHPHPPTLATLTFLFFLTLVTGPRRSFSLMLSDTSVYEPEIRALLVPGVGGQGLAADGGGRGRRALRPHDHRQVPRGLPPLSFFFKSMSLKYAPSSEPLNICAWQGGISPMPPAASGAAQKMFAEVCAGDSRVAGKKPAAGDDGAAASTALVAAVLAEAKARREEPVKK